MARPKNKNDLLSLSENNYHKLMNTIETLPKEGQAIVFPEGTMNRNIRDVLAHLHQWHLMLKDWYEVGMRGEIPAIPAQGYNWRTTPALNKEIWKKFKDTDYFEVKSCFQKSHSDIMSIVTQHSNEELFDRGRYPWTGSNAMGAYFIGALSSHYDWGLRLIKRALKERRTGPLKN